jgi:hypothetical protein
MFVEESITANPVQTKAILEYQTERALKRMGWTKVSAISGGDYLCG